MKDTEGTKKNFVYFVSFVVQLSCFTSYPLTIDTIYGFTDFSFFIRVICAIRG